jgi:hypothetical protein
MIQPLLTIRTLDAGDTDDSTWPALTPEGQLRLADGEVTRWRARATVSEARPNPARGTQLEDVWKLPEPADIVITDRRLAFTCRKFEKGSVWFGTGVAALALTGASALLAAGKRRGRIAAGQVRFEWPRDVTLQTLRLLGRPAGVLLVTCGNGDLLTRLMITITAGVTGFEPDRIAGDVAKGLVADIARFRLAMQGNHLAPDEAERLSAQAVDPAATMRGSAFVFELPGALPMGAASNT